MVSYLEAFKKLVNLIVFQENQMYSVVAKVDSYDSDAKTCDVTPVNGDCEIFDVKTQVQDGTGLELVPKIGSFVVVSFFSKDKGYVSQFGELEQVNIKGDKWALIKTDELKTQIDKNSLLLDQIKLAFNSWTPVTQDGGAVLKGLSASFVSLSTADLSNIENDSVKHGNS
jgi:hypothetical protein